jgi:hypothetical protein
VSRARTAHSLLVLLLLAGASCTSAPEPVDSGLFDAGMRDASAPDVALPDAGPPDAGRIDAGPPDTGPIDAGALDAGMDAGEVDGGPGDAGAEDGGTDAAPLPDTGCVCVDGACRAGVCHPFATWDPLWSQPGGVFTNGNLSATSVASSANVVDVRTTFGRTSGRMYWELTVTAGSASVNAGGVGIALASWSNTAPYVGALPGASFGWGLGGGHYYHTGWTGAGTPSGAAAPPESAVHAGVVYMFALDFTDESLWIGQDGAWYNGGDPALGTSPALTGVFGIFYPAVSFSAAQPAPNAITANFGQHAFVYPVPTGFQPGFY